MKHILMRTCVSPFEYHTPLESIERNLIGNNSGNMLFQYSVLRSLLREDTKVSFITEEDRAAGTISADRINATFDMMVLPFANAFREPFTEALRGWTRLIRDVKIPVVVVGIGLQDSLMPTFQNGFPFDEDVRKFVDVILAHSARIGVRGEVSAAYLKHLGYPASSIDIIGCPSLYLWGDHLPMKTPATLTKDSVIGITGSVGNPPKIKKLLMQIREAFPHYYYIPQLMDDLKLMYAGVPIRNPKARENFPKDLTSRDFTEDHARFFLTMQSLLDFMPTLGFDIGTRFHGGVGPILGGVPSLFMPTDARVQELVDYHELVHIPYDKVPQELDLIRTFESFDFKAPLKNHAQRFNHYVDFLKGSGLSVIDDFAPGKAPLDRLIKDIPYDPPLKAINVCPPEEIAARLTAWSEYQRRNAKAGASPAGSGNLLLRAARKARRMLGKR